MKNPIITMTLQDRRRIKLELYPDQAPQTVANFVNLTQAAFFDGLAFYRVEKDRLIFGSEIKAILESGSVPRDLDLTALSDYLSLLYVPAPKTIFRSVRKLPAAHYAVVTSSSIAVHPYWDLPFRPCSEADENRLIG